MEIGDRSTFRDLRAYSREQLDSKTLIIETACNALSMADRIVHVERCSALWAKPANLDAYATSDEHFIRFTAQGSVSHGDTCRCARQEVLFVDITNARTHNFVIVFRFISVIL